MQAAPSPRSPARTFSVLGLIVIIASLVAPAQSNNQAAGGAQQANKLAASHKQSAQNVSKQQQQQQAPIDELLRDTLVLLDALDHKVQSANNRTPQALMRDNLRALADDDAAEPSVASRLTDLQSDDELARALDEQLAVSSSSASAQPAARADDDETRAVIELMALLQPDAVAAATGSLATDATGAFGKRARQLSNADESIVHSTSTSDFTERHIKFTLDLMHSIFASQQYSSKNANHVESFLISPVSIQTVLMMMHLGARGNTRRELANCLHLGASQGAPALSHNAESEPSTTTTTMSPSTTLSSKQLKRRHQQLAVSKLAASVGLGGAHRAAQQQQQQQQPQNAHELFGSALRNLLKDASVMKALTSANQIFVQRNLQLSPQYEAAIKHYYATEVRPVDFQQQQQQSSETNNSSVASRNSTVNSDNNNNSNVQQIINDWVERQTRGRIANFLGSPVPASTLMLALNVLFYKGDWQYKFDPADTETDAVFTQADGRTQRVPMMVNKLPLAFAHDPHLRASVIELPYKAHRLGMFMLLPDETSGIFHTMQTLNSTSFANLIASMRKPTAQTGGGGEHLGASANGVSSPSAAAAGINVRIPKFSIESSPRLSQVLTHQLGLKTLFAPDVADLSGMFAAQQTQPTRRSTVGQSSSSFNVTAHRSGLNASRASGAAPPQVGLDELLHKAVLQIDEQGSVAAASSATIVERLGVFNGNYFEADHPFLLFLMDKQTGLVLFSGVYAGNNVAESPPSSASGANNPSGPSSSSSKPHTRS